jgi:type II secretory pathway component PulJ
VNARRGGVLLEILLAIALFAGAAIFTLGALRNALAGTQRASVRMRAVDLAASRMAGLEQGIEREEDGEPDPDGLRVVVETDPSGFPGLVLATVRVRAPAETGDGDREVFALRQLVRSDRSPRRRRRGPRRAGGFTLFEILVSVGLFGLLVFAMSSFLGDARRVRTRVAADVERNLAVAAMVGELGKAVATCVAADGGRGVRGAATSIEVAFAGVPAWKVASPEPQAALGPMDTFSLRFDEDDGRVEIGRDGGAATRTAIAFEAVRFRFLDGDGWVEEFDSTELGRLPRAVELSIWFAGRDPVAVERPEFDAADGASPVPARPADRRRIFAVPDADDGSEGGAS